MIRVTTNGVLRNYKSNLMRSSNNLNDARNKVLTGRNFNTYAEDPSAAARSFQLRRALWNNDSHIDNSNNAIKKFESAWDILGNVSNKLTSVTKDAVLTGLSDQTGHGREPLGSVLKQSAQTILQSMNNKYGTEFIFNGADGLNVPFSMQENADGTVQILFRGLDVSDPANKAELDRMAAETTYTDIGLGFKEDANGNTIPASAFNTALNALNFLGYGTSVDAETGETVPNNVIAAMHELGQILSRCTKDASGGTATTDGEWASDADQKRAQALQRQLEKGLSNLTSKYAEEDTQAKFLKNNLESLETNGDNMAEQWLGITQIDLADAITNFSWAQYCYNAALKVGNSILSESLIDYMR